MKQSSIFPWAVLGVIIVLTACLGVLCLSGGVLTWLSINRWEPLVHLVATSTPETTPNVYRRTIVAPTPAPTLTPQPGEPDSFATPAPAGTSTLPEPSPQPYPSLIVSGSMTETLFALQQEVVPTNDLLALAAKFEGKDNIPTALDPPPVQYQIGDELTFWVSNTDTEEKFQVTASLRYITDHLYFWIDNDARYNPTELRNLAETFESQIYPTNREFFGSEWTPGVDADPHLYILYASGVGSGIAGYFSSSDEYLPLAQEYSNAHEMFILNADLTSLSREFTYGVLAHEFQHMIHWYRDRNEMSWLNEGFAELAAFINGYDLGGFDREFTADPDLQLNHWPGNEASTVPHYGASFLFTNYFLNRFGEDATKAVVANQENGLDSFDQVLKDYRFTDPLTGDPITIDDVFLDWALTNYIQDSSVGDGRFTYQNYPGSPQVDETESISRCPTIGNTREVRQYGTDYIRITCPGDYTLHFEGSSIVKLLPEDPYSGSYAFWSNSADESDMTLTREFDFTGVTGSLTMSYWTWYDLEEDFDYVYLEASTDGKHWVLLTTPSGTASDLTGNNYGWAYNGKSGRGPKWIQEEVDLSRFAGQRVMLRFEYVTDTAVSNYGFMVDDISIPEVGYTADFENGEDGWEGEGFVRVSNILPQTYRLALITVGGDTSVEYLELGPDNTLDIPLTVGGRVREVVLVVTGTTRYTRIPSWYQFDIR